jgi:hypothetical protein
VGGAFSSVSADSVRIGVNIRIPAPVLVAPAPLVVIHPGVPVYFYGGGYYTFYNGAWFVATRHGGPWGRHAGPPPWERHPRARHWREVTSTGTTAASNMGGPDMAPIPPDGFASKTPSPCDF